MYRYWATVLRVIDGETLDLKIDLGFNIFTEIRAHLYAIEKSKDDQSDLKAVYFIKQWVADKTNDTKQVVIDVRGKSLQKGKSGQWIVDVMYNDPVFTNTLSEALLIAGYAEKVKNQTKCH